MFGDVYLLTAVITELNVNWDGLVRHPPPDRIPQDREDLLVGMGGAGKLPHPLAGWVVPAEPEKNRVDPWDGAL